MFCILVVFGKRSLYTISLGYIHSLLLIYLVSTFQLKHHSSTRWIMHYSSVEMSGINTWTLVTTTIFLTRCSNTSRQSWPPFLKADFQLFLMVLTFQLEGHPFDLWIVNSSSLDMDGIYSCRVFTTIYIYSFQDPTLKLYKYDPFFKSCLSLNGKV